MPGLEQITPSAVTIPAAALREAVVLDDVDDPGDEVRCTVASLDPHLATDPMPWTPHTTAAGEFWPRRGDRAVLAFPPDGPPVIAYWEPSAETPEEKEGAGRLPNRRFGGLGIVVGANPRGTAFETYGWILTDGEGPPPDPAENDIALVSAL